ncbi:hypothetical protein GCM10010251_76090 [Streptomyces aurantiogriseus]|uniref:Uncharacterized protein n=1 Tax=Streptomyces aurantiogriseus TaxID=66870 RepID=A0A918FKV9_9ACTN|nr:hypothetical protein GCM10010251_76090 [Streptomyces aurantiogriseus]
MGCRCGARGAGVGEPPHPAPALAGEKQPDGAGAAAVATVPAAASLVALAGPQVGREYVAAGVPGEMSKGGRASGWCCDGAAAEALPTDEGEPACV